MKVSHPAWVRKSFKLPLVRFWDISRMTARRSEKLTPAIECVFSGRSICIVVGVTGFKLTISMRSLIC